MNSWWGLQTLQLLGRSHENSAPFITWLQACQLPNGGFTYQPAPEFAETAGVDYTWAGVRALQLLGAVPANRDGCVAYLHSLANADGGCGDQPSWASNPMATYRAIDALRALEAFNAPRSIRIGPGRRPSRLSSDLRVFSIQLEAHGQGSPAEAVDLAHALRIHLWGAKNADPQWLTKAQHIADKGKVPVTFFVSDEEYGTWVDMPGLGTYSHASDIVAPAGRESSGSLFKQGVVSWPAFRERRLAPLQKVGGRLVWQFGENEELVRLYLDDSVERGGYSAISTFHFGNPDFTNSEPFLNRWRGKIPFVALQDAHGPEPWWFADMTTGFRTVFLANEPTWDGWLNALQQNWTVPVRHDALSGYQTWMHSGSREVLEFVRAREREWRWWDNPEHERPLVSVVAVRPDDAFEAAKPERGITVRVRCAWENTGQGQPKAPLAELLKLIVDDVEQRPALVTKQRTKGAGLSDHYHALRLPDTSAGRHSATARIRVLATNAEVARTIEFDA